MTAADPLVWRLAEALSAMQHRYRTRRGFGAYVTPALPAEVIDAFAEALAPILREAARDAARDAETSP